MTRKEMITACVDVAIKKGVVTAESRTMLIKTLLNGNGCFKAWSKAECERMYTAFFKA